MRRSAAGLLLAISLSAGTAQACLGPISETTLFFDRVPATKLEIDVAAEIVLESVADEEKVVEGQDNATARITRIVSAPHSPLKAGDVVKLRYMLTDCGPYVRAGEKGLILARERDGKPGILYPYDFREHDKYMGENLILKQNRDSITPPHP